MVEPDLNSSNSTLSLLAAILVTTNDGVVSVRACCITRRAQHERQAFESRHIRCKRIAHVHSIYATVIRQLMSAQLTVAMSLCWL